MTKADPAAEPDPVGARQPAEQAAAETIEPAEPPVSTSVDGSARAAGPAPRKSFVRKVLGQWPLAIVLAGVAIGLIVVATSHWRLGCSVVGGAITVGGVLRCLPGKWPGLLAVRRRPIDMIVLLGVGIGIVVLAWVVPPDRG